VGTAGVVNPEEPDPVGRMEIASLAGAPRLSEIFWALGASGRQGLHIVVLPEADLRGRVVCIALCGTEAVPTRLAGGFMRMCDECREGLRVIHRQVWQELADEA
jgi:hypothetical protein